MAAKSCRVCQAVAGENEEQLCPECYVVWLWAEDVMDKKIVTGF